MSAVAEKTVAIPTPPSAPPGPQSTPCPNCSAPVEATDAFCPACGAPQDHPGAAETTAAPSYGFRCENCGAQVRCEKDSRSTTCPFCAAPYVVEYDPRQSGRQEPEFVIGFAVPPDQAETIYRDWLKASGVFRPGDLHLSAQADGLRGMYLPFWSFSVRAESAWSAQIGENWYRTETYTETDGKGNVVTRTRQVQETEWWPLEGGHHAYHSFYLVSGSKGLPQKVSEWIQPFQLLALKRYSPKFLPGWLSEEYSIERDAAYQISEEVFRRRESAAIGAFLPGDTHSQLQVETRFLNISSDLILLPIYLRSYQYKGKLYRTLINGQTGKIEGEKPVSGWRIFGLIALVLIVALIVFLLFQLLGGGR
jgi:hypothetical protein